MIEPTLFFMMIHLYILFLSTKLLNLTNIKPKKKHNPVIIFIILNFKKAKLVRISL